MAYNKEIKKMFQCVLLNVCIIYQKIRNYKLKKRNMTGNNYINQNRTETFQAGDKVVMHTCCEARLPKYKDKLWICKTDSFLSKGKEEVVFLEDFSGYFATEYLQRIQI